MIYAQNQIDYSNYNDIFFHIEENKNFENNVAHFIFKRVVEKSFYLFVNDPTIINIQIGNQTEKDKIIEIYRTKQNGDSTSQFNRYKCELEIAVSLLAEFIEDSLFLDNESLFSFKIPSKEDIFNKPNKKEGDICLKNETELDSFSYEIDNDLKNWNKKTIYDDDFGSVLYTINSVLKYKRNKLFTFLLCEAVLKNIPLALIKKDKGILAIPEDIKHENESVVKNINILLKKPRTLIREKFQYEDIININKETFNNVDLYVLPASYERKLRNVMDSMVSKSFLHSSIDSIEIQKPSISRI